MFSVLTRRIVGSGSNVPPSKRTRKSRLTFLQLEGRDVPSTGLGVANDYSAFVLHDVNAFYSDVQGRVAVGGDASFTGYSVGDSLANSNGTLDTLIVGGNLIVHERSGECRQHRVRRDRNVFLVRSSERHDSAGKQRHRLRRRNRRTRWAFRQLRGTGRNRHRSEQLRHDRLDRPQRRAKRVQRVGLTTLERQRSRDQCPGGLVRDREHHWRFSPAAVHGLPFEWSEQGQCDSELPAGE